MKNLLCLAVLFPLLSWACTPDHVKFSNGAVRAMAPGQTSTAVYMNIQNTGNERITIKGVSSPDASTVSLHRTVTNKSGVAQMQPMSELVLQPTSTTVLEPGGIHVMLQGLKEPIDPSKAITLVFTYSDNSTSTVQSIPVKTMLEAPASTTPAKTMVAPAQHQH